MRIVLATYNLHRCVGRDRRFDPQRTLAVLRELDADAIALQELQWNPDDARHLLEEFARELGCVALAGQTLVQPQGRYGNAILSRIPVRESERIGLGVPGREPRGAIDAVLDSHAGPLRLIATHLGLAPAERREQTRRLLARLDTLADCPTVLLGDLNEWFPWGRPHRWLTRRFGHAPAPPSFPSRRPVFALDRILVRPSGMLRDVRVHASERARIASDHLPVRAEIEMPDR